MGVLHAHSGVGEQPSTAALPLPHLILDLGLTLVAGVVTLPPDCLQGSCSLSLSRRSKVARVVGVLASHTADLQENVPVIEVISFIADTLLMAEKAAFDCVT